MKYFLALAFLLGSTAGMTFTADEAEAVSISNPKGRAGLRKTQSRRGNQAFAMTAGGAHCGWTSDHFKSQRKANFAALRDCRSRA